MKVAVIGAGIVGITTAYELCRQQHDVTVFERHSAAAEEASFANAGVVAPGYVTPWAAPGMPLKVLKYLMSRHAPVRLGWPRPHELSWMRQWLKACKLETYQYNRANLLRLALYSRDVLHDIVLRENMAYDRGDGYLVLLRGGQEMAQAQLSLPILTDAGIEFKIMDGAQARLIEPALNVDTSLQGAIHLPADEVGNCRQYALLLKNEIESQGVRFAFQTGVMPLSENAPTHLHLVNGTHEKFDAVVVCAGIGSVPLLASMGTQLPIAAVHGYAITAAVRNPLDAPKSGLMDERYKVSISRLGQRVRVAGSAEFGGNASFHHPGALRTLYKVMSDWFPGGAKLQENVQVWKGARPMLPDGPPILGPSTAKGVWLNVGHGSSGWALSSGCARILADLVSQREPEIDLQGLGLDRLRH